MPLQIQTPTTARVIRVTCLFSCILLGVQICTCDVTWSRYEKLTNTRLTVIYDQMQQDTNIMCCSKCNANSMCKSVNYNSGSKECQFSSINLTDVGSNSENNAEWATFSKAESFPPQSGSAIQAGCSVPTTAANAVFQPIITSAMVGDTVDYTCNPGYDASAVQEKMKSTCQANGDWSTLMFECFPIR